VVERNEHENGVGEEQGDNEGDKEEGSGEERT